MQVTKVEPVTKTKSKVYLEEQFAFVLYKGELLRYDIKEGHELTQEKVDEIKSEILSKRVKLRAMYLLNQMDRTEQQLRTKLKKDLYTDEMIETAISYVKSYGYIADEEYAKRYITSRQKSKSRREIAAALYQKGIAKEVAQKALEVCYLEENELGAIRKLAEKRHFDAESATLAEKKKMCDYLLRKGFAYSDISQVIQVSSWNA